MIWTDFIVPIVVGIVSGILATLLYTKVADWRAEKKLRETFAFLSGRWEHLTRDQEVITNSVTQISYIGRAVISLDSQTTHGRWSCRIVMNSEMPNLGGGVFQYADLDESGSFQIVVKSPKLIHVAPVTITHEEQKTDFYMWRKLPDSD